jgi:hypothetical protein
MMESTLVRRDQFSISRQGIIHKPTDAAFTPHFGDPRKGTIRLGSLRNRHPNGNGYRPDDVQRIMRELWARIRCREPGNVQKLTVLLRALRHRLTAVILGCVLINRGSSARSTHIAIRRIAHSNWIRQGPKSAKRTRLPTVHGITPGSHGVRRGSRN